MEPIDFLRVARRRWWIVAVTVVVFAALAWLTTPPPPARGATTTPIPKVGMFEATHTLVPQGAAPLGQSSARTAATAAPNLDVLALYAQSGEVPRRVAAKLNFSGDPALLVAQIQTTVDNKAGTIRMSAKSVNGERAATLVNTFAAELLAYLAEQQAELFGRTVADALARSELLRAQLQALETKLAQQAPPGDTVLRSERDALGRQYSAAFERYQQLNAQGAPAPPLVTAQLATPIPIAEKKQASRVAVPSDRGGRTALAELLGLLVGIGLAFGVDRLDTRLRSKEQFEEVLGLPVLAEIPRFGRSHRRHPSLITAKFPQSGTAEAFRMLRASLSLAGRTSNGRGGTKVGPPQVVLITSPAAGDGKTTVAANLAASFADAGRSVLILDCDFWRPAIHGVVGAVDGPGVLDALDGEDSSSLPLAQVVQATAIPGLRVVTAGCRPEQVRELLRHGPDVVTRARRLADIVIIDTGPVLTSSSAAELLPAVDAVVVVARAGRTGPERARRAMEILTRLQAPTVGVVVTDVEQPLRWGRHYTPARRTPVTTAPVTTPLSPNGESSPDHEGPTVIRLETTLAARNGAQPSERPVVNPSRDGDVVRQELLP